MVIDLILPMRAERDYSLVSIFDFLLPPTQHSSLALLSLELLPCELLQFQLLPLEFLYFLSAPTHPGRARLRSPVGPDDRDEPGLHLGMHARAETTL